MREADYVRFLGKLARVRFEQPGSGKKRTVVGVLDDFSDDGGGRTVPVQSIQLRDLGPTWCTPLGPIINDEPSSFPVRKLGAAAIRQAD